MWRALRRLLSTSGYETRGYESGIDFMASLATELPDCVVLDLHMPRMDGFAVLTRMGAEFPAIPVIVITGHDSADARQRTERFGVAGYFRKPVDGQTLVDAIEAALEGLS